MSQRTILVVAEPFGGVANTGVVAGAIGRGLRAGDPSLEVDLCPLDGPSLGPYEPAELRASLDAVDLDARMRRARAVVIAAAHLDHRTLLRGGAVFEIATRARQGGVPCYAVAGRDGLDLFEKRILDLQIVLEASEEQSLRTAAKQLGADIGACIS